MTLARPSREHVLAAFRRQELLAAALRVFGRRGFDGATVDAIAAEARVAKGTVYVYFRSKRAFYDATIADGMAELLRLTEAGIQAAPTCKAAIHAFVSVRVEYFQSRPDFFRLYVSEVARQITRSSRSKSSYAFALDAQTDALRSVLERAIAEGQIRDVDPAAAALVVFDTTRGLIARRLLTCPKADASRDIEFLTDLIWTGFHRDPRTQGPTP